MVRILIVDDKASIRDWVREFLADQPGWQVCGEAENGVNAVEQAATFRPHVIILDVSMPEMIVATSFASPRSAMRSRLMTVSILPVR